MFLVPKAICHLFDRLYFAVESFTDGICNAMPYIRQDICNVPFDCACCFNDWFQATVGWGTGTSHLTSHIRPPHEGHRVGLTHG